MVVVTGVVFFTLRALFALMPAFANRYAIKIMGNRRAVHSRLVLNRPVISLLSDGKKPRNAA